MEETNGKKLKDEADRSSLAGLTVYGLFKLHIVPSFRAAFSRQCHAAALTVVDLYVCYISLCVCSVLMFYSSCSLSLSVSLSSRLHGGHHASST